MSFEVVHPAWLGVGLVSCLVAALLPRWGQGPGADLEAGRRPWVIALRCLILLLLWLALAGLRQLLPGDRQAVIFLVDRSLSARGQEAFARDYITRCLALLKQHQEVAVITFGGDAMMEVPPSRLEHLPAFTATINRGQTDIASALRFACAGLPANSSGRLVLLSDGQETRGDSLPEAEMARRMGFEVAVVPFPENSGAEVLVESLKVPEKVRPRSPFEVGITIQSTRDGADCQLILERNQHTVASQLLRLHKGKNFYLVAQRAEKPELLHYRVRIQSSKDTELANNRAESTVVVEGPARLLYVLSAPGHAPDLTDKLRASGLEVDVVGPSELPSDLSSWQAYQAVVLDNVSALELSSLQLDWLTALVGEAGMGLTMLGGTESFGAGGYYGSSLAQVLPVNLDIRRNKDTPVAAMIFLIDKSGSMAEQDGGSQKMAMAREAAIAAVELMSPQDEVGVIAFDEAFKWVVELQKVEDPKKIAARIATLRAGGGTSLYGGLDAALKRLSQDSAPVKHALVLTDGMVEPANFKHLTTMANHQRITVSTVAVGHDADVKFLAELARDGKGRSYLANSASALPRVFARDTVLASRRAFVEKPSSVAAVEPHALMRGIEADGAPELLGYNLVSPRGAPCQVLMAAGTAATAAQSDPVLAVGRYGLGKTVAFMGDSGQRWCKPWSTWAPFSQLLQQAVRWTLPEAESDRVRFTLEAGAEGHLLLSATVPAKGSLPNLRVGLISPGGLGSQVPLKQVGPRRFEALLEADQPGAWLLHAEGWGGSWTRSFGVPYSRELASVGSDALRLQAIAAAAEGLYAPSPEAVMSVPHSPRKFSQEIWPQLLTLALLLLPLEVGLRRVTFRSLPPWRRTPPPTTPEEQPMARRLLVSKQKAAATRRRPEPIPQPEPASPPSSKADLENSHKPDKAVDQQEAMARLKQAKRRTRKD